MKKLVLNFISKYNKLKYLKAISKKDDVSKICIVGPMMLSNREAISKIFKIASEENIEIYMISFSELAINIIVDTQKSQNFMTKLHENLIEKN